MQKTKKILIVQEVMKQYRLPFYYALYEKLQKDNTQLLVCYSEPKRENKQKADNADLPIAYGKTVRLNSCLGGKLIFQHCLAEIWAADFVIVEQANKHIINYLLMLLSFLRLKKVAFWGHGKNFQAPEPNFKERLKKRLISRVDWWFAYTEDSAKYVASCGFDSSKITNVENSIDVQELQRAVGRVSDGQILIYKQQLGVQPDSMVGLYCGAMYSEKQLPFLCDSLLLIKECIPQFHFVFAGGGPAQNEVEKFCEEYSWAHFVGPVFGEQKALCFASCDVVLNPCLVGLGVLDCFATAKAMLTTNCPGHGPEFAYIKDGFNGLVCDFNEREFANTVVSVLQDNNKLSQLTEGVKSSRDNYSIENMANNFAVGINQALKYK